MTRYRNWPLAVVIALLATFVSGLAPVKVAPANAAPANSIVDAPLGEVFATAAGPAGSIFAVGDFTAVGAATGGFALLDGNADVVRTFPPIRGSVRAIIEDGRGGWFIGGNFSSVGGLTTGNLARIDGNGDVDTTWTPIATGSGEVMTLALAGSRLYVGGNFSTVRGTDQVSDVVNPNLAVFDANTGAYIDWATADFEVKTLTVSAGTLYAGGNFTTITPASQSPQARSRIAAFQASSGALLSWAPEASDSVWSIVVDDTLAYVGGSFASIGGATRNGLAAVKSVVLDDSSATAWDPDIQTPPFGPGQVQSLALDDTVIYAVGAFASVNGDGSSAGVLRSNAAAFDTTTGIATPWDPSPDGTTYGACLGPAGVMLTGAFTSLGSAPSPPHSALAIVDKVIGLPLPWDAGMATTGNVLHGYTALTSGTSWLVGGSFTHANAVGRGYGAAFDSTGQVTPWDPQLDGTAFDLAIAADTAFVVGNFSQAQGQPRAYAAAFSTSGGGAITGWDPDLDNYASAIAIDGTTAYLGGFFGAVGSTPIARAAGVKIDDTGTVTSWDPQVNAQVLDVVVSDGEVYLGGYFTSVDGETRNGAASVSTGPTALVNPSWNPNVNGSVHVLEVANSTVYLGGIFTSVGGQSRLNAASVDASGTGQVSEWNPQVECTSIDCQVSPDTPGVFALEVVGDVAYLGGFFETVRGGSRQGVAAVSSGGSGSPINAWSPSLQPQIDFPVVRSLRATNDSIVIGGSFTLSMLSGALFPGFLAELPLSPGPPSAPGVPTGVSALPGDSSATVSWTPGSTGSSPLTRVDFALDDTNTVYASTSTTTSPHILTGLVNGQSYTVYVRLVNSVGEGDWSAASTPFVPQGSAPAPVPPPADSPSAPLRVQAVAGNASADVTWSPPDYPGTSAIESYRVTALPGGQTCRTSGLTCSVVGLRNGTPYRFTVQAFNASGPGQESAPSPAATPRTVPRPPADVRATAEDGAALIKWIPPTDDGGSPVTGYRVVTTPASAGCATSGATQCTITGLAKGTEYAVRVLAENAAGASEPSAPVAVTPRGPVSVLITGSRDRDDRRIVRIQGAVEGAGVTSAQPYFRLAGQTQFRSAAASMAVVDGSFSWQRKALRRIAVYVEAGGTKSNTVIVRGL